MSGIKRSWIAKFLLLATLLSPEFAFCEQLKVVTYNIWGLPSPLLRHPERFNDLANTLNTLDADIILIQEAFTKRARALTQLSNFRYFAWGPSSKLLHFSSGLLVLSKYPILETQTMTYSKCGGFDCFANKGALYARVLLPDGKMISVFDTHLNANGHSAVRYHQASELITFVRRYSSGLPAIVGGDFNGDKPSFLNTFVRTLTARNAHAEFVHEHHDVSKEELDGFTANPRINPFLNATDPSYRLDHIFLIDGTRDGDRAPSAQENWKILNDQVILNGRDTKILSDHLGVRVTVDL
jgi:endonuclease/exonuclease/phosphatase family metal-dependent hydrolase